MDISLVMPGLSRDHARPLDVVRLVLRYGDVVELFQLLNWFYRNSDTDSRLRVAIFDFGKLQVYRGLLPDHEIVSVLRSSTRLQKPIRVVDSLFNGVPAANALTTLDQRLHLSRGQVSFSYSSVERPKGYPAHSSSTPNIYYNDLFELSLLTAPDELIVEQFDDLARSHPETLCKFLAGKLEVVGAPPRLPPAGLRPEHLEPFLSSPFAGIRENAMTALARLGERQPERRTLR